MTGLGAEGLRDEWTTTWTWTRLTAAVRDLTWHRGARELSWTCRERRVTKAYDGEIVSAVVLRDATGVAVVEPEQAGVPDNAVVFDADGVERYRLARPCRPCEDCHFAQIYYVAGELTAFAVVRGTDFALAVDEVTGAYGRRREAR